MRLIGSFLGPGREVLAPGFGTQVIWQPHEVPFSDLRYPKL